jgi:hypothetical protein
VTAMYLARYAFDGDPADLLAKHRQLHDQMADQIALQIVVERPDGVDVYDACPSEEQFRDFSASAEFLAAIRALGLPVPRVEGLGAVAGYDAPYARVR